MGAFARMPDGRKCITVSQREPVSCACHSSLRRDSGNDAKPLVGPLPVADDVAVLVVEPGVLDRGSPTSTAAGRPAREDPGHVRGSTHQPTAGSQVGERLGPPTFAGPGRPRPSPTPSRPRSAGTSRCPGYLRHRQAPTRHPSRARSSPRQVRGQRSEVPQPRAASPGPT